MQFTGRLVADAQLRETKTGKKVTGFTVAMNETYRNREGERVQNTTYVQCSYWNRPNITGYLTKGRLLTLTGFMGSSAWVDRDGGLHGTITCRVDMLEFLTGAERKEQRFPLLSSTGENGKEPETVGQGKDDDLPF